MAKPASKSPKKVPPPSKTVDALVDIVLAPGSLSDATKALTPKALATLTTAYKKLQKTELEAAMTEVVALSFYLDEKKYAVGAEQLRELAMSSGPALQKQKARGWAK